MRIQAAEGSWFESFDVAAGDLPLSAADSTNGVEADVNASIVRRGRLESCDNYNSPERASRYRARDRI